MAERRLRETEENPLKEGALGIGLVAVAALGLAAIGWVMALVISLLY